MTTTTSDVASGSGIPATSVSEQALLRVDRLNVEFDTPGGVVHAVSDVSFELAPGERLAVVGESGSGKSVMSMALTQLVARGGTITGGSVELAGRDVLSMGASDIRRVRGGSIGFVFQDPSTSLNPVMSIGDQLTRPMRRHLAINKPTADRHAADLLTRTGIPDPRRTLRSYPHQLSGGMRQRVMIAMAISCQPVLLVADEPTTALDVTIQAQIVELLRTISDEQRTSVIFVTHDMGLVARFADRVAVMYAGRIVEIGAVDELFADPRHPYTRGLLASIPSIDGALPHRLSQIDGTPPNLAEIGPGCAFAPRCPVSVDRCVTTRPPLAGTGSSHAAACWVTSAAGGRPLERGIERD